MAGIGKRFEAFRLLESISLMAFYYICFCQVLPKNIQILGRSGAHKHLERSSKCCPSRASTRIGALGSKTGPIKSLIINQFIGL